MAYVGIPGYILELEKKMKEKHEKMGNILPMKISMDEVRQHNKPEDCYVIVKNKVFDVTLYLQHHPGGVDLLFRDAGGDATSDFEAGFHSKRARAILDKFYIGDVVGFNAFSLSALSPLSLNSPSITSTTKSLTVTNMPPPSLTKPKQNLNFSSAKKPSAFLSSSSSSSSSPSPAFSFSTTTPSSVSILDPIEMRPFKLIQVKIVNHNTKTFRFQVDGGKKLDLRVGSHLSVCLPSSSHENKIVREKEGENQSISRPYTPIVDEVGFFELLVKKYENGLVSSYLHSLKVGDSVMMRGPYGSFKYSPDKWENLVMIAGGTGIAPFIQFFKQIFLLEEKQLKEGGGEKKKKVLLLFANKKADDILLKEELSQLASLFPSRLEIYHFLSEEKEAEVEQLNKSSSPPPTAASPPSPSTETNPKLHYQTGRITFDFLKTKLPPPSKEVGVLVCGPLPFNHQMKNHLVELHFSEDAFYLFE
eukprot:TRINITY_DN2716_c0_g1_i1.p1 TRINITY_DN2716_c0_g1~~TRINITY_DN2716_c0_g1_i1.p1  ORF type:complete len:475 (+),score=148.08 TRINITY_DN2716_c0_g1_i1:129-1553(+)